MVIVKQLDTKAGDLNLQYLTCYRMLHHMDGHSGTSIQDDPNWYSKDPEFSDQNYPLSVNKKLWSTGHRFFLNPTG